MPHSFADQPALECPQCGAAFAPDVWLIIDAAERPDLLAHVLDGTLHRVACPSGHSGLVDAPLLLFRPGETPPVLFCHAAQTTAGQDRAMADGLLGRLAASLGEAWRDEWAAGLLPLPRRLLVEVLNSRDVAATIDRALAEAIPPGIGDALGEITAALVAEGVRLDSARELEEALAARPELRQKLEAAARTAGAPAARRPTDQTAPRPPAPPNRSDPLLAALQQFVEAETWLDSYRRLRDHPELLTDAAEARLAGLAARAAEMEDEAIAGLFAEHLALLRRAREVGVGPAFAEKLAVTADELEDRFNRL